MSTRLVLTDGHTVELLSAPSLDEVPIEVRNAVDGMRALVPGRVVYTRADHLSDSYLVIPVDRIVMAVVEPEPGEEP